MIPPAHVTRASAEHIEQMSHELGWDQPPRLIELSLKPINNAFLAAEGRELPFANLTPSGNPALYLRILADQFGEGHLLSDAAKAMATSSFCGLAFICEAWLHEGEADEEDLPPDKSLADIPGSREVRMVTVVDTAGRIESCMRVRGERPQTWSLGHFATPQMNGGRVPAALRDMVLAIALHMPSGTADLDALRGLKLEAER